jgi:hypothetical protein
MLLDAMGLDKKIGKKTFKNMGRRERRCMSFFDINSMEFQYISSLNQYFYSIDSISFCRIFTE